MARHEISLTDLLSGKPLSLRLTTGESHDIVVRRNRVEMMEFADSLFRFNSAVLLPNEAYPPADGVPHPGLDVVAACLHYANEHKSKSMLLAGHTDTVGGDEANVRLSAIRAQAVHGILTGNRDEFATACWGPHLSDEQRYPHGGDGSKARVLWNDYSDVLNWLANSFGWPCRCGFPGGPPWIYDATLKFKKAYNASAIGSPASRSLSGGVFDKLAWGAVYDCYEVKLAEILAIDLAGLAALRAGIRFVDSSPPYVSCGEFKPIDQLGRDHYRSQKNRRAEALFFDPGEAPHPPCFDGVCVPTACDVYDPRWYKRKPLPPLINQTGAHWDRPDEPAAMGDKRKMLLDSAELHAGDQVEFQVSQQAEGRIDVASQPVRVTAVEGHAEADFSAWYARARVTYAVELKAGKDPDAFPPVQFSFVARVNGKQIECEEPLRFGGSLDLELRRATPSGDEPLGDVEYVFHCPWGTRMANTTTDGRVVLAGLPPGGMALSIDGVTLLSR